MELVRVKDVKPVEGFIVHVWFTNGTDRDIDLEKYISTGPMFEQVRTSPEAFRSVKVTEGNTIGWDDADICPDMLYYDLPPALVAEVEEELTVA